jgi:hypothetical protein
LCHNHFSSWRLPSHVLCIHISHWHRWIHLCISWRIWNFLMIRIYKKTTKITNFRLCTTTLNNLLMTKRSLNARADFQLKS